MATTITTGASTIAPTQVLGYASDRASRTILHPIIGSAGFDVTLRVAKLRSGTLSLGFQGTTSEADSRAASNLLSSAATFMLDSTDRTSIEMKFTVQGRVHRELEDASRSAWIVSFDYQEIP